MSILGSQWKEDAMKEWELTIKHFKDGGAIGDLPKECVDGIIAGELAYKKSPQAKKDKEIEFQDQIEQYIESRVKEYKDRAQELQGLVFTWRIKLKEQLIKEIKNSDIVINKAAKIEHKLLQFDNHFKITTLRHGNTEN